MVTVVAVVTGGDRGDCHRRALGDFFSSPVLRAARAKIPVTRRALFCRVLKAFFENLGYKCWRAKNFGSSKL
jgi:hypothetical protein